MIIKRIIIGTLLGAIVSTVLQTLAIAEDHVDQNTVVTNFNSGAVKDRSQVVILNIQGNISTNLLAKVQQSVALMRGNPFPTGLIVFLNSLGGDGVAAMKIGRLLRQSKAHVFVSGKCGSACVLVLAGGVLRSAPPYSIGIHRGRITVSNKDAKILSELDIENNDKLSKQLNEFEQQASSYLNEMGIPGGFFEASKNISSNTVRWLSADEISFYGLNQVDPIYLNQQLAPQLSQRSMRLINEDMIENKLTKVLNQCHAPATREQDFIVCYRNLLTQ